jgi:Mor family transcriptional regulator
MPQPIAAPAAESSTDFLQDVIERIAAAVAGTEPDSAERTAALQAAEAGLRKTYGGERVSVRLGHAARDAAIRRDYQRGEHYALLERRYGLTARHIRRIIHTSR